MKKEMIVFVKHILDSIRRIDSVMENVSEENFLCNEEKQSAVIRQLEIIGEAVKNIRQLVKLKKDCMQVEVISNLSSIYLELFKITKEHRYKEKASELLFK